MDLYRQGLNSAVRDVQKALLDEYEAAERWAGEGTFTVRLALQGLAFRLRAEGLAVTLPPSETLWPTKSRPARSGVTGTPQEDR